MFFKKARPHPYSRIVRVVTLGRIILVPEVELLHQSDTGYSGKLFTAVFLFAFEHLGDEFLRFVDEAENDDVIAVIFRDDESAEVMRGLATRSIKNAVMPMVERLSNKLAVIGPTATAEDAIRFVTEELYQHDNRPS